jgi:broad specificity phosphatase PhoE
MTLYLVRHGKTEYNIVKRYTGSTDVGLSDEGMLQAEKTAELLKDIHFDLIVSSPLLRAKITADEINLKTDHTLKINEAGALGVNTAKEPEKDNTLPITAAAVHTTVGNIEVLLGTI